MILFECVAHPLVLNRLLLVSVRGCISSSLYLFVFVLGASNAFYVYMCWPSVAHLPLSVFVLRLYVTVVYCTVNFVLFYIIGRNESKYCLH
jgi:hypothetical protein